MANVKKLLLTIERLESGFSVEEFNVDANDKTFTFMVSFPKTAAKGLTGPDEEDTIGIKGKGDLDIYYEKPYKASMEGPGGGGYDIGITYASGFVFVDANGKESRVDPKDTKTIEDILNKQFEDEFLERIESELEEYRKDWRDDNHE